MELKCQLTFIFQEKDDSSNCTFMELKSLSAHSFDSQISGSNCTFMELKWEGVTNENYRAMRSNCTFMELKLFTNDVVAQRSVVLIVPLWNWNTEMWKRT